MSINEVLATLVATAKHRGVELGDYRKVGDGYLFTNGLTVSGFEAAMCSSINDMLELVKVKLEGAGK